MQILTKDEIVNISVVTVVLGKDPSKLAGIYPAYDNLDEPLRIRTFYCCNCQKGLLQYDGQVVKIIPGLAPADIPIFLRCDNERRNFQTSDNPYGKCNTVYYFDR